MVIIATQPMAIWTFLCYVDDDGEDAVSAWLKTFRSSKIRDAIEAKLDNWVAYFEVEPVLGHPLHQLKGERYHDLMELDMQVKGDPHRFQCCYGPYDREFTILIGAREDHGRIIPSNARDIAMERRLLILRDRERRHVRGYHTR